MLQQQSWPLLSQFYVTVFQCRMVLAKDLEQEAIQVDQLLLLAVLLIAISYGYILRLLRLPGGV